MSPNQNPEEIARDAIDAQLRAAGWTVQDKDAINVQAGRAYSKADGAHVDAPCYVIGVTKSLKTASRWPTTRPTIRFQDLAMETRPDRLRCDHVLPRRKSIVAKLRSHHPDPANVPLW